jgi:hypothetical protein
MMRGKTVTAVVMVCVAALGAWGEGDGKADRDAIKQSMKARYARLMKLKREGIVGETTTGMVEAVENDAGETVKELVAAENADRRRLYELIAGQTGTTTREVAGNNALRLFKKASPTVKFKTAEGAWKSKAELKDRAP